MVIYVSRSLPVVSCGFQAYHTNSASQVLLHQYENTFAHLEKAVTEYQIK